MTDFSIVYDHVEPEHITHRIIFNPNYSNKKTQVPGTCMNRILQRVMKPGFFAALEASVSQTGWRNPILLYSTSEGLLLSFGGSRLRVAKRLGILIPAIIVDYTGNFEGSELVRPDNWKLFFQDVPEQFEFTDYGIDTHYSIERNRRDTFDPAGIAWTDDLKDTDFLDDEFSWLDRR
jgi:hypothetical protein